MREGLAEGKEKRGGAVVEGGDQEMVVVPWWKKTGRLTLCACSRTEGGGRRPLGPCGCGWVVGGLGPAQKVGLACLPIRDLFLFIFVKEEGREKKRI